MTEQGPGPLPQQAPARRELPRRFYQAVTVIPQDFEFAVALDGRAARTPARRLLSVPSAPLAEAIAAEWRAQDEVIDPARMPLTRLVNSALDGVTRETAAVREEIQRYAGTDLLCYRAGDPQGLVRRQTIAWDPILAWARETLGVNLVLAQGIMHVTQPTPAIARLGAVLAPLPPLRLAAVHTITTLTGSALLALAVLKGRLPPEAAWEAAHVDEDWNVEQWGADEEAMRRREARWAEMLAAARLLELTA
jgi:chaperone required for assembly of F1-ATPase